MTKLKLLLFVASAGLLGVAGCDRGAETQPARVENTSAALTDVPSPDAAEAADTGDATEASATRSERADPRDEPVPVHDTGAPVWAPNSRRGAMENAERQFERNGQAFGAKSVDEYVDKVHAFVGDPPAGTLRHTRNNGDKLFYDPKGNVFAVATKDGAPRTMFKPDDGRAYWEKQKQGQARGGGDSDRG